MFQGKRPRNLPSVAGKFVYSKGRGVSDGEKYNATLLTLGFNGGKQMNASLPVY